MSKPIKYKEVNGTSYHEETQQQIVNIIEAARLGRVRLRFSWGDTETGKDWGDTYDVEGYIGRSSGSVKVPLLLHNARSIGGSVILDHCIVKIEYANKKNGGILYQHQKYHL